MQRTCFQDGVSRFGDTKNKHAGHQLSLKHPKDVPEGFLSNPAIAELLAVAAESAKMPLQKARRRASRKAFLWEEEAALLSAQGRGRIYNYRLGLTAKSKTRDHSTR